MKKISAVIAVVIGLGCAVYIGVLMPTEEVQSSAPSEPVIVESPLQPSVEVVAEQTEPVEVKAEKKQPPTVELPATNSNQVIQEAMAATTDEEQAYFDFIENTFPDLKDSVQSYRSAVLSQRTQVNAYKDKVQKRNHDIELYGYASATVDSELEMERNRLLAEARYLGEQAAELNQRIREAAGTE